MDTMWMIRLERGRPQPEIIIQLRRHRLRDKVGLTRPVALPVEARGAVDRHLQRPAEHPALDELFNRLDRGPETIKLAVEPEPRIEPEDASVFLNRLDDLFALADGAGHGFFAPDILARLGGRDRNQAVPVRRGNDVNNINIIPLQNLAKVVIALDVRPDLGQRAL